MKNKSVNFLMMVQWLIFMPILFPMAAIAGAVEGIIRTFDQAKADILDLENTTNSEVNELI
ncbi:hypothetical protein LAG90_11845 [Marinilongibacter aquaticus]|uniref:hypothetical protein n=1 Tax=Marinilongibacter aquaticus TaxID=2975157 RepID=UPI0021BD858C|nr:hypothetical protein [Marinilongibacter aquaticus]UBM57510.1 hypothetical protein LAG90_11845 [Marinilongibacter aquaticus]